MICMGCGQWTDIQWLPLTKELVRKIMLDITSVNISKLKVRICYYCETVSSD